MGRPRRKISPDGFLTCSKCREAKHITQFYTLATGVWWTDGTHVFGKPQSWCIDCVLGYHDKRKRKPYQQGHDNLDVEGLTVTWEE